MTRTSLPYAVHAATDVGQVRSGNEDSFFAGEAVVAVADGMGGHVGGEIASSRALGPIEALDGIEFDSPEAASNSLAEAIAEANRLVLDHGEANPELSGMGTTLTAALVREGYLHVAHVGDSRAYLLRDGELTQLTSDHTLVEQMVRDGQISRAEAAVHPHRSVLTRAIGVERGIQVDTPSPVPLTPGDQVLLCSDGLTGPVEENELAHLLSTHDDGDAAVRSLIDAANAGGGPDNITVVLLRVLDDPDRVVPAPPPETDTDDRDATARLDPVQHEDDGERPANTRSITTAPTGDYDEQDWAQRFGRYGQQQGAEGGGGEATRHAGGRRRTSRVLAVLVAIAVLAALLGGGGYALLSRAYFVGADDGEIAIFQGIPETVVGFDLHWKVEDTGLRIAELPDYMQRQIERGVGEPSLAEARQVVERYERTIDDARDGEADEEDADEEDAEEDEDGASP